MLWGGGGLGARPEGVPQVGEPQEKELCAIPPAALGYVNGSGEGGAVLPGGLRLGSPVTICRLTNRQTIKLLSKMLLMGESLKDFAICWRMASVSLLNACSQLSAHGDLDMGVPGRHILANVISPSLELVQLLLGSVEQGRKKGLARGIDLVSKGTERFRVSQCC
jgi:hypothetical protein